MTDPQTVLLAAAVLIERHGLTKGKMQDAVTGAICAVMAIRTAAGVEKWWEGDNESSSAAYPLLWPAVKSYGTQYSKPEECYTIAAWNNAPATTAEIVVETFRRIARGDSAQ